MTGTAPAPCAVVDFDDHADTAIVDATRTSGDAVTPADPVWPAVLLFRDVDLSGAVRVQAETALENTGCGEARWPVRGAFAALDHFDGVHFARRATVPTLFSVGLMDPVCPPSTVYAAFNHYAGEDRTMTVWPFGDHGGGHGSNPPVQLAWLRERDLAPAL